MSLHALVEKWRSEADSLHAPPCDDSENSNLAIAMHCCADELAAALAGGGEAVAWQIRYFQCGKWQDWRGISESEYLRATVHDGLGKSFDVRALFTTCQDCAWNPGLCDTHPAGAVRVTDDMVDRALCSYYSYGITWKEAAKLGGDLKADMRAALTAALNPGGSRE